MANQRQQPRVGNMAAVVTYARVPLPGSDELVGSIVAEVEVPFVRRPAAGVPDVHAVAADGPRIGAPVAADPSGGRRRPWRLRVAMLTGAVAIVAGIGVLAVAFNGAVNAPLDRPVAAKVVDEAAIAAAPTGARVVGAEAWVASEAADTADGQPATRGDGPAGDDATAAVQPPPGAVLLAPPSPVASLPGAAVEPPPMAAPIAVGVAGAPDQSEMDRLMREIDQILASVQSTGEPVGSLPSAPAQPLVLNPALPPAQGPALMLSPSLAEVAPPVTVEPRAPWRSRLFPLRRRSSLGAPIPPADIPDMYLPPGPQ